MLKNLKKKTMYKKIVGLYIYIYIYICCPKIKIKMSMYMYIYNVYITFEVKK